LRSNAKPKYFHFIDHCKIQPQRPSTIVRYFSGAAKYICAL